MVGVRRVLRMSIYHIRKGKLADLDQVKALADAHKRELGFVLRPALKKSIDRGELLVAENGTGVIGFVDFHHRQDERTTLYHIAVEISQRGKGIGRALVDTLVDDACDHSKSFIQLKCPEDLPANRFYQHLGFKKLRVDAGNRRALLVWQMRV